MKILTLFLLILTLSPAVAIELVIDDAEQLHFAETLLQRGEFFKAVLEFERLIHFFPESPLADEAALGVALAYDSAGAYDVAAASLSQFIHDYNDSSLVPEARLMLGRSLALAGNYEDSRAELRQLASADPPLSSSPRAGLLHGLTYLPLWELDAAERSFQLTAQTFPADPAGLLANNLVGITAKRAELPILSPFFAGLSSAILPGLGQVVAGEFWDGVMALTTNALWVGATWWAASAKEAPTAVVTGLLGFSFYLGNIYNASHAAEEFNRRAVASLTAEIATAVRSWEQENPHPITLIPEP